MKNFKYLQVRQTVLQEQAHVVPSHGYGPVCPHCWLENGIYTLPTEGHHFLVKKGDVQRWKLEDRELINVPDNIIMLCNHCHMFFGQTSHFTEWCVEYKTDLGYNLKEWLETLPFKITTDRTAYVR
jgi:hypothetical protein